MSFLGRGRTADEKLAWNDTFRTVTSPLAILVSGIAIVVSVLLASCDAKRQANAAREQREAQAQAEDIRAMRDFQLQAMLAIMAEPTCKKAVEKAAMLSTVFPDRAGPMLRTAILSLSQAGDEPAEVCSVERLNELTLTADEIQKLAAGISP